MKGGVDTRTLLLSQSYEPLEIISWRRALRLFTLGKVEVLGAYDRTKPVKLSRVNIYARDKYRCQYCERKVPIADLTYDHVVPRVQGGTTTWQNIVTACYECNASKGNRTPAQAGMRLARKPVQPKWVPAVSIRISTSSMPDAWRDYLYWTSALTE